VPHQASGTGSQHTLGAGWHCHDSASILPWLHHWTVAAWLHHGASGAIGVAYAALCRFIDEGGHPDDFVRSTFRTAVGDNQVGCCVECAQRHGHPPPPFSQGPPAELWSVLTCCCRAACDVDTSNLSRHRNAQHQAQHPCWLSTAPAGGCVELLAHMDPLVLLRIYDCLHVPAACALLCYSWRLVGWQHYKPCSRSFHKQSQQPSRQRPKPTSEPHHSDRDAVAVLDAQCSFCHRSSVFKHAVCAASRCQVWCQLPVAQKTLFLHLAGPGAA
jgi:hypothetical protein